MAKRRRSKTQQGFEGMTIPQLLQIKEGSTDGYVNSQKFIEPYSTHNGDILMPLNRSMRRHAKKMKIEIKEVKQ
ncbi:MULTISPECIES: hypothetical protein [unclassified Photorhabdus]|uniref:hypothetical protein n=1 Tax=unclassified Photorhabdus TaxID=2620880 RepID=UPI000DCDF01C|nr:MULTISPECIES: hypothetical protein [unclassified Photorhabdus]RAW90848.1 hypothetical protein CKY03_24460 [Photorhabdus sp. S9-53]RAW90982.1 hypothetical protein CKY05_24360 [Photorhabdus sp. S10-54]RAW94640.1 hypothetical protein CKY04_24435 [Photorhabdus sp. S8-52]